MSGLRGGVGSTSVLAGLGYALHTLGERVLLIDMSPDNLLRLHFNVPVTEHGGWARAMLDRQPWQTPRWRLGKQLSVLPYGQLTDAEQQTMEALLCAQPELWSRRRASLDGQFDWLLFDLPQHLPGHADVGSCELSIQVVQPDIACHMLLQQQAGDTSQWLLVNGYDPDRQLQRDLLLLWREQYGERMLPLNVHADEAMAEALAHKAPIGHYRHTSLSAQDTLSLATWCLAWRARQS